MAKLRTSTLLRLSWELLSFSAYSSWLWFSSLPRRALIAISSRIPQRNRDAYDDNDIIWDAHPSAFDASVEDDESYDLWAAYLDSPYCVRTNRAFLERIYNSESHIKQ